MNQYQTQNSYRGTNQHSMVNAYSLGNQPQDDEIDLLELANVLLSKALWIILAALICGGMAMAYTVTMMTPMYQASIRMIVNLKHDVYNSVITASDVTDAEELVATYAAVINSNRVMDRVIEKLDLDMEWTQLNNMVAVNPVNNTPVMNIVVTGPDPEEARQIVTTLSEIAPEMIVDAVEAGSCKVISDAYCSGLPVSPNVKKNTVLGMMMGVVLACGLVLLLHLLNDRIHSEEQLAELTGLPVLSTIPVGEKGGRR